MTNPPTKPPPQLPQGTSNTLRGISENFSFHASPESFITSRILQLQQQQPELFDPDRRPVIRVKILNRNVAVVTSYQGIRQVLGCGDEDTSRNGGSPKYVAGSAYDALMAPFFPGPNLLLADGAEHAELRGRWDERMKNCHDSRWKTQIESVVEDFCSKDFMASTAPFDLYEAMKRFSWQVLLKCFLDLDLDDELFGEVQSLHETLLRGQFSLMPVSLNTGFWKTPRKRGILAREELQKLIAQRLEGLNNDRDRVCLFGSLGDSHMLHFANHALMMTSSLAVKGMASLLTPLLLNVFCFKHDGVLVCERLRSIQSCESRLEQIRRICLETERLSPPIVGVMRRSTQDSVLQSTASTDIDVIIPKGWDVWLYFVGGGRDKAQFGESSDLFESGRHLNHDTSESLGFGMGSKTCLGQNFVREVAVMFIDHCLSQKCNVTTSGDLPPGTLGWLGWKFATPEQWAADMKQLPTQHPKRPIVIQVIGD